MRGGISTSLRDWLASSFRDLKRGKAGRWPQQALGFSTVLRLIRLGLALNYLLHLDPAEDRKSDPSVLIIWMGPSIPSNTDTNERTRAKTGTED